MFKYYLNDCVSIRVRERSKIEFWNGKNSQLIGVFFENIHKCKKKKNILKTKCELPKELLKELVMMNFLNGEKNGI